MQKKDTSFAHLELQCIHLLGIRHNHNHNHNQCDICTISFHQNSQQMVLALVHNANTGSKKNDSTSEDKWDCTGD